MSRGAEGYLCGRMGSEVRSDCGTALCDFMRMLASSACECSLMAA
jgi:hypothetical protein